MGETGGHLDFAQEPLGPDLRRDLGAQDFQRDFAIMTEIVGEKHDRHAALAQLPLDPVPTLKACVQTFL